MTCQPSRTLSSHAGPPALSLTDERPSAAGELAATSRVGFLRRLLPRPRLPRLYPDDLSEHRLRDLGFCDGREAPPRDGRWD
jgi:hypothetical protein